MRFIWAAGRAIKGTVVEETVAWEGFRGTELVRGDGKRVGVPEREVTGADDNWLVMG